MLTDAIHRSGFAALTRDPLVRLVMASDGVTEAELVAVLRAAQRAVHARMATGQHCDPADRRRRSHGGAASGARNLRYRRLAAV